MTMQPLAALPVDADLWWIVYLRGALVGRPESYLQGMKVVREVPDPRPARFVSIRHDGGAIDGLFVRPRVALDVWADSQQNATAISNVLIALAMDAPGTNGCLRVTHESGPNDVADPSGQPRRLSLITATHRVNVLT